MGLPCVLTDIAGAREIIIEGVNGLLVEPLNPESISQGWEQVAGMANHLDREKIRELIVEKFSLSKCVLEYARLIEQK